MNRKLIISSFILFFWASVSAQSYDIKVKIPAFAGKQVILGHYFSDKMLPDDTTMLNAKGVGHLTGKNPLPGGMYFVFLPNRRYFDILIDKNQHFSVENDSTDFLNNFKSVNSKENELFYSYQKVMTAKSKEAQRLRQERKTADETRKKEIGKKLNELQSEVNSILETNIKNYPGTFFGAFLKATQPVDVPKEIPEKDKFSWYIHHYFDNMPIEDTRFVRTPIFERTVKKYLKLVDQMPVDSIKNYMDILLDRAGANKPKGKRNEELFRFMLVTVHNHFASAQIMGLDAVFVYLAEKYYIPMAYWSDEDYLKKLKTNVAKTKPNLIGKKAPHLVMQKLPNDSLMWAKFEAKADEMLKQGYDKHYEIVKNMSKNQDLLKQLQEAGNNDTKRNKILRRDMDKKNKNANEQKIHDLVYREYVKIFEETYNEMDNYINDYPDLYEVKADNTVVWFWEPDCSHCQHETPIMADFYRKINKLDDYGSSLKNMELYCVYLPRAIDDWQKFTDSYKHWFQFLKKHKLGMWLNVWDPYGETNYRTSYNVYSTPTVYLLDETKKIIAKRIGVEGIRRIIFDNYIKEKQKTLNDKELLKDYDKLIKIFKEKKELEDLQTVTKGLLKGDVKDKAIKKITTAMEE